MRHAEARPRVWGADRMWPGARMPWPAIERAGRGKDTRGEGARARCALFAAVSVRIAPEWALDSSAWAQADPAWHGMTERPGPMTVSGGRVTKHGCSASQRARGMEIGVTLLSVGGGRLRYRGARISFVRVGEGRRGRRHAARVRSRAVRLARCLHMKQSSRATDRPLPPNFGSMRRSVSWLGQSKKIASSA